MKPEQISAINAKAEPVALYPCGFKNLHRLVIESGAFLARNLTEDEPVTDEIRSAAMVLVGYAKDMSSLLAKQPLYTHPAIEPAPQESSKEVAGAESTGVAMPVPVGAAPFPDDVKEMVEWLRDYLNDTDDVTVRLQAADMIEAQQRSIAELEQQRDELLAAAENLVRVKGRHHTEQAYKALEAAITKVKP